MLFCLISSWAFARLQNRSGHCIGAWTSNKMVINQMHFGEIKCMYWRSKCYQHIESETKWTPFSRRHFQMDFLEWKCMNFIKISLKFVPMGQINNIPALVHTMAWRHPGNMPLPEPMMVNLLTHICVTRPQWVKTALFQVMVHHWTDQILRLNIITFTQMQLCLV